MASQKPREKTFLALEFSMVKTKVSKMSKYSFLSCEIGQNLNLNLFWIGAGNRYRMQQLQQKDWCEQQIAEKQMKKEVEKINNLAFDEQALQFHDTLKYTQSEHNRVRTEQAK